MRTKRTSVLGVAAALVAVSPAAAGPGDRDHSFGGDGRIVRDVGKRGAEDQVGAVALQGNRIVVAGYSKRRSREAGVSPQVAVTQFRPNGRLDRSFAGGGSQFIELGGNAYVSDVQFDSRGRIVIAANTDRTDVFNETFGWSGVVIRLRPSGKLDQSFAGDGKRVLGRDGPVIIEGLVVMPNDGIGVAGTYYEPDDGSSLDYPSDFTAALLRPKGGFDRSFSGDGWQTTDLGSDGDQAEGIALSSGGSLAVAGRSGGEVGLVRYLDDGELDPEFSEDGIQHTSVGEYAAANDVAVDESGRMTIAGGAVPADAEDDFRDFLLARYRADGSLDPGFSEDGVQTTNHSDYDELTSLVIQRNGRIVAAGSADSGNDDSDFAVLRARPNGELDQPFGNAGVRLTGFTRGSYDDAEDIGLDRHGRIVVAGDTARPRRPGGYALPRDLGLVRYLGR